MLFGGRLILTRSRATLRRVKIRKPLAGVESALEAGNGNRFRDRFFDDHQIMKSAEEA